MDAKNVINQLSQQIEEPMSSGWTVERVSIGRASLSKVAIANREGAINFIEAITTILERTRRRRAGGHANLPIELAGAAPTRLLSVEIANFMRSIGQRKLSHGFTTHARLSMRILLAVCGDIPVSKIEPHHMADYWDAMRWWPKKVHLRSDLSNLTDAQILEVGKKENTPAPADITLNLRYRLVRSFFRRLVEMRILARSPCDGIEKGIKIISTGPRRNPFSSDQIAMLFDPKTFVPWASVHPHRWWIPMLGLYTGARVGELAQAKVKDLECVDGQWVLHLRKTVDDDLVGNASFKTRQIIKNRSSVRTVPIHPDLLEAGLLEFVDDIKKIKHPRLFPHLHARIDKMTGLPEGTGYAPPFTVQFGRYIRELGFAKTVSFHSFRHHFSNHLRVQKVGVETIAKLTGHVLAHRAPTLQSVYFHEDEQTGIDLRAGVMAFNPGVKLPRYSKGQFARQLGPRVKLYP